MKITLEELIRANKKLGGNIMSDSSLSFAESLCRNAKSSYTCASIWARAILVDHPFSDANKRTALYAVERCIGIHDQEQMAKALIRIASSNINDLKKIEEVLKNANRQKSV